MLVADGIYSMVVYMSVQYFSVLNERITFGWS